MSSPLAKMTDLRLGRLCVRPQSCEVIRGADIWVVEPQLMRVLVVLAERAGQVVSRSDLIDACWDGRAISEDAINRVLSRLRQLGRETEDFHIRTVRKVGYRLEVTAPVPLPPPTAEADPPPEPSRTVRYRPWLYGVGGLVACLLAGLIWWVVGQNPFASKGLTVALGDIRTETPAAIPPERLRSQLTHTLSQMRGLRLLARTEKDVPTDYTLSGTIRGTSDAPSIELTLNEGQSHTQVWSARFDQALMPSPAASDRAVAAAARYMAVVLGDRVSGRKSSGEPPPAIVATRISEGQRALSQAHEARHNPDWSRFDRLMADVDAKANLALAIDPQAAGALMLKYEVDVLPLYPRPGESQAQFAERQQRALGYITQAVAADPDNPDVLAAAGRDMMDRQKWAESERLLLRSVAIDPNSRDGNLWYTYYLGLMNRCGEGLRTARLAAALAPGDIWRQLSVPRLMHCAGRKAEAAAVYRRIIDQDPANVFVLREYYLMLLAQEKPAPLRDLTRHVRHDLWHERPPPAVSGFLQRIDLAADALEGKPLAFHRILDSERAFLDNPQLASDGFGKSVGDRLFVLAVEYGHTGQAETSLTCLERAVEQSSLYLPWALPYGASPLPQSITRRPAFQAIWHRTPQLSELIERRKGHLRF